MNKYEENREHPVYTYSYVEGRPERGMYFMIYDKTGKIRSKVYLDEKRVRDLTKTLVNKLFDGKIPD